MSIQLHTSSDLERPSSTIFLSVSIDNSFAISRYDSESQSEFFFSKANSFFQIIFENNWHLTRLKIEEEEENSSSMWISKWFATEVEFCCQVCKYVTENRVVNRNCWLCTWYSMRIAHLVLRTSYLSAEASPRSSCGASTARTSKFSRISVSFSNIFFADKMIKVLIFQHY